ncbi:MAG TPA: SIR2 family protein [Bacillota bacterium]|nr:SIR2 family protein [Bacillota bacterium]
MPYLDYIPKPFLDDMVKGIVLPFVGAGMSRNAIPSLPSFDKMAREMAEQIPDYEYQHNPTDAMCAYEQAFGRTKLIETLAQVLNPPAIVPGPTIETFARLPFHLVATTNFDFLLEQAYKNSERQVYPLVEEEQLPLYPIEIETGVYLLKVHGDFAYPNRIVVSETDYDAFVTSYPLYATYLASLFADRTVFFIGYSLNDYDFRFILQFVSDRLVRFRRMAYTVQVSASQETVLRFQRRGVRVINLPGEPAQTGAILTEVFNELLEYWLEHLLKNSIVTNAALEAELKNPPIDSNRLCFFAVPRQQLGLYREQIFPQVRELGLVPAVTDDIYLRGNNEAAKILALSERAGMVVMVAADTPVHLNAKVDSGKKVIRVSGDPDRVIETLRQSLEQY